jgi:uncharacterized protein YqeY
MSLREQVTKTDFMIAMKAKDKLTKSVLVDIKGGIKNKEIELGRELNDPEVVAVITKCLKVTNELIEGYDNAKYTEQAEAERLKLPIFTSYLPQVCEGDELETIVGDFIFDLKKDKPELTKKDMGTVMKGVKAIIDSIGKSVDGKNLSKTVSALL